MTVDERPTPPPEVDRVEREALDELAKRDAATLREVSAYLEEVAAWKERREGQPTNRHRTRPIPNPTPTASRSGRPSR